VHHIKMLGGSKRLTCPPHPTPNHTFTPLTNQPINTNPLVRLPLGLVWHLRHETHDCCHTNAHPGRAAAAAVAAAAAAVAAAPEIQQIYSEASSRLAPSQDEAEKFKAPSSAHPHPRTPTHLFMGHPLSSQAEGLTAAATPMRTPAQPLPLLLPLLLPNTPPEIQRIYFEASFKSVSS
jgi:hypothetical protein